MIRMSPLGRAWLADLEGGHQLDAYQDIKGVWTIGAGATFWPDTGLSVKKGDRIATESIAEAVYSSVLSEFEDAVERCIGPGGSYRNGGPFPAHVTDALISFCYNIGKNAFAGSTAVKRFNRNFPLGSVAEAMSWYKRPNLVSRRRAETDCLLRGIYADQGGRLTKLKCTDTISK